jgi:hypothetical protein
MAVVYSNTVKDLRMTQVINSIDGGAGAGYIEIGTTGMVSVLATITLADPSGTTTNGVLTLSGFPRSDTTADATGTAAEARIRDSNAVNIVTGLTVGTSGANINLSSLAITAGDTVTLNSAVITHG